ncbi:MAG: hypothetical protein D6743_12310 [Calditrichaeota bacterium]|nr:MAG: hypothetical protein D6743_12310 [Calditrichota bacterium]
MNKFLAVLCLVAISCGQQEQKQEAPATGAQVASPAAHGVTWHAPEGWITESPSSSMRKAQYRLPRAEGDPEDASVVVFYFQGQGGGVQANIHRWYSQFIQPDGRATSEVAKVETATVNGHKQTTVDITGTYLFQATPMSPHTTEKPGFRMLATVIETPGGPYFVKFVGPEKTVTKWQESYHTFVASFK